MTPLAQADANCYRKFMWRETLRRILVLIVAVAFAAAFQPRPVEGFGVEAQTTAMSAEMSADMPASGMCDGCSGSEKSMTPSACSTYCTTVAAMPFLHILYQPIFVETIDAEIGPAVVGHTSPPDPYPPRPTRMS